jgi:hypothetical protein
MQQVCFRGKRWFSRRGGVQNIQNCLHTGRQPDSIIIVFVYERTIFRLQQLSTPALCAARHYKNY